MGPLVNSHSGGFSSPATAGEESIPKCEMLYLKFEAPNTVTITNIYKEHFNYTLSFLNLGVQCYIFAT